MEVEWKGPGDGDKGQGGLRDRPGMESLTSGGLAVHLRRQRERIKPASTELSTETNPWAAVKL